jgi:hypothetical protein
LRFADGKPLVPDGLADGRGAPELASTKRPNAEATERGR